jgi:hypothetical protein
MFERTIQVKSAVILGTRPEIIKMSPVIRECKEAGAGVFYPARGAADVMQEGPGEGEGVFCAGWGLERCGDV